MTLDEFINKNYNEIMLMSRKICKGSSESPDVAHYVIMKFLEHSEAQALIDRNEAMKFLSGMIWRNFNSSTSPYHKIYRQKGRVFGTDDQSYYEHPNEEYDYYQDIVIDQTLNILNAMTKKGVHLWYIKTLFEMYLKFNNYSEISRKTGIPRTSISHAVEECKQYLREELKKSGISYD